MLLTVSLAYELGMVTIVAGPAPCFSCFPCALRAAFSALFCFFISAPDRVGVSFAGAGCLAGSATGGG